MSGFVVRIYQFCGSNLSVACSTHTNTQTPLFCVGLASRHCGFISCFVRTWNTVLPIQGKNIRNGNGKGKSVPLQAWSGPEGSRKLSFPDFLTTAQDGGRLLALRTGRLYPQGMLLVLISVRGWVDPRAIVRTEGFCQWKILLTPAGFETAIFRFVAQRLKHCATAVTIRYTWV